MFHFYLFHNFKIYFFTPFLQMKTFLPYIFSQHSFSLFFWILFLKMNSDFKEFYFANPNPTSPSKLYFSRILTVLPHPKVLILLDFLVASNFIELVKYRVFLKHFCLGSTLPILFHFHSSFFFLGLTCSPLSHEGRT